VTIRDMVKDFVLADVTVGNLLGTRMYPDRPPQKAVYPVAKIKSVDTERPGHLRGPASLAEVRMQFDVWAAPTVGGSRAMADRVGAAIRRRLTVDGSSCVLFDTTTSPPTPVLAWIRDAQEREGAPEDINGGLSDYSADFFVQYQTHGAIY